MTIRIATSKAEILEFQRLTDEAIGIKFPLSYLVNNNVTILEIDGEIQGGYVFVESGPFRAIQSIPNYEKYDHLYSDSKSGEINGVWLDQRISGTMKSVWFWFHLAGHLIGSGKTRFYFAYSNDKIALGRFYQIGNISTVYSGPTRTLEGMKAAEEETVAYITRNALLSFPISYRREILRRCITTGQRILIPVFQRI